MLTKFYPPPQPPHLYSLQPRQPHHKIRLPLNIQTIIQMRRQNQIPMQTDIIPQMTIRTNPPRTHPPKRLPLIRIPKQHHTINKPRLPRRDHLRRIMRHLRSLAIPTNTQLRLRALRLCQRNQLRHILTSARGATFIEARDVGCVIVYALDGYLGGTKFCIEGGDEGRADYVAYVAGFSGAAGED